MPEPGTAPLTGAFNFRDLGGFAASGHRRVRRGMLFRSDTLQALTDDDVTRLVEHLGVEVVIDLRIGPEAVAEGRGPLAAATVWRRSTRRTRSRSARSCGGWTSSTAAPGAGPSDAASTTPSSINWSGA